LKFEGLTDDNIYSNIVITDPTVSSKNFTIPSADSVAVQPLACGGTDKVSAVSTLGVVTCTADQGGAGGDSMEVEDGDNLGTFTAIATTGRFEDSGDINFVNTANDISALVRANAVALTDDTTGNYVATITAGAGLTGDATTEGSTPTLATASGEANFLASGALTCGAATQGKTQVHTTPLQYCDNAGTPALQYAAYGDSSGKANIALDLQAGSEVVGDAEVVNTLTLDNITQITTRSHTNLSDIGTNSHATIDTHIGATAAHGATGAVMGTTNAQSPTNKTLDAGIATTTHAAGANFLQAVRHATDCTAITDGLDGEFCYEKDSNRNFMCEPTAGGCDTAAEWIDTTPSGGGITTLNTQTGATQTFSKVDDTNVTLAITSATNNHEFALGWAGTLAAGRLNANVVQAVTNDTNVTGSIATQNLTLGWAGILGSARGGTGNGFTLFSGPATTEKTFTLPNASATILTTNALVTGAQGGTNNGFFEVTGPATTLKSFTYPNASATVLTTNAAVTVAQGGSGATTLTGLLQGTGTSAFTAITDSAVVGAILRVTGVSTYAWGPLNLADIDATTGTLNTASSVGDAALATGAVDGGLGGEIADGTVDSNDLATANKTITKDINIFAPATGDTNKVQIYWPAAATLGEVECSIDAGTSVTIQLDERAIATPNTAGVNSLTASLVCDTDSQSTTSFSDAGIASQVPHNLQITGVVGTVGVVRIHIIAAVN